MSPHRYVRPIRGLPAGLARIGFGLRDALAAGYRFENFRKDAVAGLVVAIVALPLAIAVAIASGAPPQFGLYSSIVAGIVIALAGGTRVSVSGPTAAFVVLFAPIHHAYGLGGLMVASTMAGVLLIAFGLFRLGRLIQFIPHPVTTGLSAGIAVVIAGMQLRDFLGLQPGPQPAHFPETMASLWKAADTFRWRELAVGVSTLAVLLVWPRITRRIPGPLVALTLAAIVTALLTAHVADFRVDTIGSRFEGGIPRLPPHFDWPWNFPGRDGEPLGLTLAVVRGLFGSALAIAISGAIQSLLCAVVGGGIAGTKHEPDVELTAQGLGNVVAPFFGGIAATGALARTVTGVRAGARTPIASIMHSVFILVAVLALAPLLGYLPMSALAALLLVVAWDLGDAHHFGHVLKVAPRSDMIVLLSCFGITIVFDMVTAVFVGIVLAALLFMQRMSELFQAQVADSTSPQLADPGMEGVVVYQVAGPLFFGAAEKAASALARISGTTRALILQMNDVPVMDVTGLVALESAIARLRAMKVHVVLVGVQGQPRAMLDKSALATKSDGIVVCDTPEAALASVRAALAAR